MKIFTKKSMSILTVIVCLYSIQSFAQCQADFTWNQSSPNVIDFTDASTGITSFPTFNWNFGDGNYGYFQNLTHTYIVPGTYYVCLTIWDSSFCTSNFCDSVTVTGTILCNLNVDTWESSPASCSTCADGYAYSNAYGGTQPYTYSWSNSATTSYASGLLPGMYSLCVTDANGCTACDTVIIHYSSCTINFSWTQSLPNIVDFNDISTGTSIYAYHHWTFGDGNQSYSQNPSHTYNIPGTYNVCLTVTDSLSYCNNTYCTTITVTGNIICNLTVNAYEVNPATCSTCNDGSAQVYPNAGTQPYTYLWSSGDTIDYVDNLLPGSYTVCVTDLNGCTACDTVMVNDSSASCIANFSLYPDTSLPHTYYAVNLSTGSPSLLYLWSWGDGDYDTTVYPTHTYDTSGVYQICLTVYDSTCSDMYCINSYLSISADPGRASSTITINVIPPWLVGIHTYTGSENISVFPNPFTSTLTISSAQNKSLLTYRLFSMQGAEMLRGNIPNQEYKLNLEGLSAGIFILEIRGESGSKTYRKLVKE
jgi:PKD repeat protein